MDLLKHWIPAQHVFVEGGGDEKPACDYLPDFDGMGLETSWPNVVWTHILCSYPMEVDGQPLRLCQVGVEMLPWDGEFTGIAVHSDGTKRWEATSFCERGWDRTLYEFPVKPFNVGTRLRVAVRTEFTKKGTAHPRYELLKGLDLSAEAWKYIDLENMEHQKQRWEICGVVLTLFPLGPPSPYEMRQPPSPYEQAGYTRDLVKFPGGPVEPRS